MTIAEQVIFRQYRAIDNEQVKSLHREALASTNALSESGEWDSDLDDIESVYIEGGGDFIVGVLNDEIVAMGAFKRISSAVAGIKRMRVKPELQGNGIGPTLLALLESNIREKGYIEIQLDTTINQVSAQHLYEKSGYTEIRRETEGWPLKTIFYSKVFSGVTSST
jgi:ribosomal protein S18 acetylase RimI-like enzyme